MLHNTLAIWRAPSATCGDPGAPEASNVTQAGSAGSPCHRRASRLSCIPVMPDDIESLYTLALSHHQSGELQQADALYRHILAINPDHVLALIMLGVLAHQVGRNDVAIQLLARAIQLDSKNPDAHNNLGVAFAA